MTGKGYGDYATKQFLIELCKQRPDLVFLYMGDFDIYGMEIYLDYLFGSKKSSNECLCFQPLVFLGPT